MSDVKQYTAICSAKTLQSNANGFFLQFANNVRKTAGDDWLCKVFGKLKTDRERLRCLYYDPKVKDVVLTTLSHVQEMYREKSAEISRVRRFDAEKLFEANDIHGSLILLSQAILRAPKSDDAGHTLSYGLWARSGVLMKANKFELALKDVQFAIKEGLPEAHKAEAYWRMAICYKALQDDKKSSVSHNLALNFVGNNKKVWQLMEESLQKTYTNIGNPHTARRRLDTFTDTSTELPCASRKVTLKREPTKGRFIIARDNLKTGDIVVQEDAYASCLLPECSGAYCHHCYDRLEAPVGCSDCSSVAFCSIDCRDTAMTSYHKFECHFLDLLLGSGMSILAHVALRMVTQSPLEYLLRVHTDLANGTAKGVYNLCTLSERRSPEDFLQRTIMSAFLLRCLQKCGYFGYTEENIIPNENQLKIGEILLYNLQMLQFNAHEIYESKLGKEHRFRGTVANYIAVAVYSTAALFNHSCSPTVTRHFIGKQIVLRTCRPVQPGDEIADNYGPNYSRKAFQDRQKYLKGRYWFDCKCIACMQNWPMFDNLKTIAARLICPNAATPCNYLFTLSGKNKYAKCPRCGDKVNIAAIEEEYRMVLLLLDQAIECMDREDVKNGIKCCCKGLDAFYKISCAPQINAQLAEECLRALFADSGNVCAASATMNSSTATQKINVVNK